ncbi:unnamed protein product [Lupinus luteus]|uniref:Uncharacterized protein n=1 Tax=Lupinus luteus TaxID=3873 RepID=A0AAV1YB23_LUPLU
MKGNTSEPSHKYFLAFPLFHCGAFSLKPFFLALNSPPKFILYTLQDRWNATKSFLVIELSLVSASLLVFLILLLDPFSFHPSYLALFLATSRTLFLYVIMSKILTFSKIKLFYTSSS